MRLAATLVLVAGLVSLAVGSAGARSSAAAFHFDPAWSPDGKQIAFADRGDVPGDLYVMRADGSDVRQLTHSTFPNGGPNYGARNPTWSPDGKRIAFAYGFYGIAIVNSDGTGLHRIVAVGDQPAWSPRGRRIAFAVGTETSGDSIDVVAPDGSHRELVAAPRGDDSFGSPSWTRDGEKLAFTSGTAPDSPARPGYVGVVVQYRGRVTRYAQGRRPGSVDWAPSGRRLVFSEWSRTKDGEPQLVVLDVRTGRTRRLHAGRLPRWSPDGARIAFVLDGQVWTMRADGSHALQLTR